MGQTIVYGLAAGAATALLFSALVTGMPIALLLYLFTPLPAFLAGALAGRRVALIAAAAAAVLLVLAAHPMIAMAYAAVFGVPSLLLLGAAGRGQAAAGDPVVGLAVALAGGFGALNLLLIGPDAATYRATLNQVFEVFRGQLGTLTGRTLSPEEVAPMLDLAARTLPATAAISWLSIMLGNLWLAGRLAASRGAGVPPWQGRLLALPGWMPATFMASLALTYFGAGQFALLASAFAAAHGAAYLLQGLALIHRCTLGYRLRPVILIVTYAALAIAGYYVAFAIITFALAAPILGFDRRPPAGAPPFSGNTPT
jgi:hypothetical protein